MEQKKIVWILFVFAILIGLVGVFSEPGIFGLGCVNKGILCNNPLIFIEGEPFLAFSIPLLFMTPILFFVRREVFITWAKFAGVFFPLMLAAILYTYNNTPVIGGWISGPTDDQLASVFLPPLFVIISIAIIGVKSWKLRKG